MNELECVGKKAQTPVHICLCTDENYAPHCATAIHAVICNRSKEREYAFFVLARRSALSEESMERFKQLEQMYEQVTVTVLDVADRVNVFQSKMRAYYTQEINYRFLLFTELFAAYDRMLYMDCDTICVADVGELYDMPLTVSEEKGQETQLSADESGGQQAQNRYAAAAVLEYGFLERQLRKVAMFHKGIPCSYADYIRNVVGAEMGKNYFNSGVMLYDLSLCRELINMDQVSKLLAEQEYAFPDQDCLNHLLLGKVKLLPSMWNYQSLMAHIEQDHRKEIRRLYAPFMCDAPKLLHFTSGKKPWTDCTVPWYEEYKKYVIDR